MALAVIVDGPALIKVGTGTASALEEVGYTINGAEAEERLFSGDVPGDQNGGDEGPPIDIQYFGRVDTVRLELSKYDEAVVDKIRSRVNDLGVTAAGAIFTSGSLYAGGSYGYRLVIHSTNRPRNYLFAIPREPTTVNKGTKFSRLILQFECHAVAGILYNSTTS